MPDQDTMVEKLLAHGWEDTDGDGSVWTHEDYPEETFAVDEAYETQFPTINPDDLDDL